MWLSDPTANHIIYSIYCFLHIEVNQPDLDFGEKMKSKVRNLPSTLQLSNDQLRPLDNYNVIQAVPPYDLISICDSAVA